MGKTGRFLAMIGAGILPVVGYNYGRFLARTRGISGQEMALIQLEQRRQLLRLFLLQDFDLKGVDEIRAMIASRSKER